MVAVPTTRARLSHALTIRARGRIIGAIHQWSPAQSRTVDTEFEIEPNSYGMPVDLVPQRVERREIRIARYDTYPEIMEEVFGTSELIVLADQYRPFTLREVWRGPPITANFTNPLGGLSGLLNSVGASGAAGTVDRANATVGEAVGDFASTTGGQVAAALVGALIADTRVYEYFGCYFTDVGRTLDAKGDRVVSVEATLTWLGRRRVA